MRGGPFKRTLLLVFVLPTTCLLYFLLLNNRLSFRQSFSADGSCLPQKNIVFLKTHKTAGSSLQNIFMRYGVKNDLLFVLPLKGNYIGHPAPFNTSLVPKLKWNLSYNILCHHARWNPEEIRRFMPTDSVYVTVLRDPVQLFESLYAYYRLENMYGMSLERYSLGNRMTKFLRNRRYTKKLGRNQMLFDLGMDPLFFDDDDYVTHYISKLDREFHLVLIAERMDESLILLKHQLCWDLDDVVVFRHNARPTESKKTLKAEVVDGIRYWNKADQMLYDYFYTVFQNRVNAFGEARMLEELKKLREKTSYWHGECVESESSYKEMRPNFVVYNKNVIGFKLKKEALNTTCNYLVKNELPFTYELQARQKQLLNIPLNSTVLPISVASSNNKLVLPKSNGTLIIAREETNNTITSE